MLTFGLVHLYVPRGTHLFIYIFNRPRSSFLLPVHKICHMDCPSPPECSYFSPPATVILLILLCFEGLLFLIFTAVMFGTQVHSICSDETVSRGSLQLFAPHRPDRLKRFHGTQGQAQLARGLSALRLPVRLRSYPHLRAKERDGGCKRLKSASCVGSLGSALERRWSSAILEELEGGEWVGGRVGGLWGEALWGTCECT